MPIQNLICFLFSFLISLIITPIAKKISHKIKNDGQPIYEDCPEKHKKKVGTATLGGMSIILSTVICSSITLKISENIYIACILFIFLSYGSLGLIDDLGKLIQKKNRNDIISPKIKLSIQIILCCIVVVIIEQFVSDSIFHKHTIKIYGNYILNIPYFIYIAFFIFVVIGSSNATNLTDGIDGLLLTQSSTIFFTIAIILINMKEGTQVKDFAEISKLCMIISGSSIGLLWFNCNKATIFTGDIGSLALGGTMGAIAIITGIEIILIIISLIFIIETISVILQVIYFKYTKKRYGKGKRIFLMTPIHHHFELSGMGESKIVLRFWIITLILCIFAIIYSTSFLI